MTFLNIIVLYNPNYNYGKNKPNGTSIKNINLLQQFICLYDSIKKNLKIPHDIYITHYDDFNEHDMNILKKLQVNFSKVNVSNICDASFERYNIPTKVKGTHRLICETDMLLINNPPFEFEYDFQAGYAGKIMFKKKYIDKLVNYYNLNISPEINYKFKNLFYHYNIIKTSYKKLYPHFNNGLILIKEHLSHIFYKYIIDNKITNTKFLPFIKKTPLYQHISNQIMVGLILTNLTNNWKPFKPGINYLFTNIYEINKFGKDNIYLLHYCGSKSYHIANKCFPKLLNHQYILNQLCPNSEDNIKSSDKNP